MTYHSNITDKEKFQHICDITTSVAGLRKGSLAFKSRKHKLQLPRLVAANIGRINEIHHRAIAEVLKRDRSLIYHYENTHSANYTSWADYRKMFNLVHQAFTDIENTKPTVEDSKGMKNYLLEFVNESKKNQVEIMIISGKVGCKIVTSFADFSSILKKIKFALTNYNHSIQINLL